MIALCACTIVVPISSPSAGEPTVTHWLLRPLSRNTPYICDVADDGTGDVAANALAKLLCCDRALELGVERLSAAGVCTYRGRCVRMDDPDSEAGDGDKGEVGERAGDAVAFLFSAASAMLRCDSTSESMAGVGSPASETLEVEAAEGETGDMIAGCGLS